MANSNRTEDNSIDLSQYATFRHSKTMITRSENVSDHSFTSIICMNQTSHKYYVYSLNGLLINRVYFQEETNKFGSIIATSSNGQYYVFKKHLKDLDGNQGKPK